MPADATGVDRWRVGAALAKVVDATHLETLVATVRRALGVACRPMRRPRCGRPVRGHRALVGDRRYGAARQELVIRLGGLGDPRALPVLVGLLDDADVTGHAVIGLRKLGCPAAAEAVRPYLTDRRAWVRAEARKTLAELDDAGAVWLVCGGGRAD